MEMILTNINENKCVRMTQFIFAIYEINFHFLCGMLFEHSYVILTDDKSCNQSDICSHALRNCIQLCNIQPDPFGLLACINAFLLYFFIV